MGQAGSVKIAFANSHNLGFRLETPKRRTVNNSGAVPLVLISVIVFTRGFHNANPLPKFGIYSYGHLLAFLA